jgi:hypothetical protein
MRHTGRHIKKLHTSANVKKKLQWGKLLTNSFCPFLCAKCPSTSI